MHPLTRKFIAFSSGGLQAALLLICVWMWSVWMHGRLTDDLVSESANASQRNVELLARSIIDLGADAATVGSESWNLVNGRIHSANNESARRYAVIRVSDRSFVHHPGLESDIRNGGAKATSQLLPPVNSGSTWNRTENDLHIAGRRLIGMDLAVVSWHDRVQSSAAAWKMIAPLQQLGSLIAVLVAIVSGVITSSMAKNYEERIDNVHEELDTLVETQMHEFTKTRDAIIYGLARLAESRDTDTGAHLDRIQHYSCRLAQQMQAHHPEIDEEFVDRLKLASTLHDIGKVGIPDEILLKPGRLTDKERKIMQQHAVIGSQCLREIRDRLGDDDFLEMAHNIAIGHHEHWDGNGYPFNVANECIPLEARIVAVADVYDALRSRRVYKDSMSHDQASRIIREGAGTQFDPEVVHAFELCSEEFEMISQSATAEPELCLLEKIRECLHGDTTLDEIESSLSFLQDAERDAWSIEPAQTSTP